MESQSSFVQKRTYSLSMVLASYCSLSVHLGDLDQLKSPTFLPYYSVVIISFVKSSMFFQFSLSLILPMLFFLPSFVSHFLEVFLLT